MAVNFGEPIKLAEFLEHEQPGWRQQELAPLYRPDWLSQTTNRLGEKVAQQEERVDFRHIQSDRRP